MVSGPHPIEAARDALDRATRLLTGHLPLGADTSVRQSEAGDQLASLNDVELLRRSSRELLIRQIGLCKIMSSRGVLLIREKPAETGVLLKALAHATRAAARALNDVGSHPAGHLLPHLPPSLRASYTVDRTYKRLLGTLDAKELTVWAECLFVDPIADLAVLGVPDGQELIDENKQYEVLTRTMTPLRVASVGARVGLSQSEAAALLRG